MKKSSKNVLYVDRSRTYNFEWKIQVLYDEIQNVAILSGFRILEIGEYMKIWEYFNGRKCRGY